MLVLDSWLLMRYRLSKENVSKHKNNLFWAPFRILADFI